MYLFEQNPKPDNVRRINAVLYLEFPQLQLTSL